MAKEILIADSDKTDQKEFRKIFEATDYNVVFSESGEQVLLRIKLFKPDLIIAGASLKEKSGLEVCKVVKADPESKHIPIILLSNLFKEFSDEDRKRVRADGVITTPFQEDEILNLVDRLMEEQETKGRKEGIIGKKMDGKSTGDIAKFPPPKEGEFLLDELADLGDEEIVDLVDVVEEPERKMSIDDFVPTEKETSFTEITPLESWEKLMDEEKPADRRFKFGPDDRERGAKGMSLQWGEEAIRGGEVLEKDLLDKIELEEILQKVEQLAPSVEKEWSPELRKKPQETKKPPETVAPAIEEPSEKYAGLAEFEAALSRGVGAEPQEEKAPPFYAEKEKKEAPVKVAPAEVSLEKGLKEAEEFAGSLLEKIEEEELKEIEVEEFKEERIKILREEELPEIEGEETRVIEEPEEERIEILEGLETTEGLRGAFRAIEKPGEERIDILEGLETPESLKEAIRFFEEPKGERDEIFEEIEISEILEEEVKGFEKPKEEGVEIFEELEISEILREEVGGLEQPKEEKIELFEELLEPPDVLRKEVISAFEQPKEEKIELFEELLEPPDVLRKEVISAFEQPKEEKIELFEELLEPPDVLRKEVIGAFEQPKEEKIELFEELLEPPDVLRKEVISAFEQPKEEKIELFEELLEPPDVLRKEVISAFEQPKEEKIELLEEAAALEIKIPEVKTPEVTAPVAQREEMIPPFRAVERQLEEVISRGAREMMEGFITKLVPEMTQNIINLTIDRIERMVKEIVPELAEKMIQEEINRLQKKE